MKFYETNFIDYIETSYKNNMHTELTNYFNNFDDNFNNLPHMIFYGMSGIGKYTQSLNFIKKYSETGLKYDKKFVINFQDKKDYTFKLSDIHFEIDMELLGCNAKILWLQIYLQIIEIITIRPKCNAFILIKNFHNIHSELLDKFYSYMQKQIHKNINIKFILLTESISFIPNNILNICKIISIKKPNKIIYKKCFPNYKPKNIEIDNLKLIKCENYEVLNQYNFICNNLYEYIINYNILNFIKFRDYIYDILTYQLKIENIIYIIIKKLIINNYINNNNISKILYKLDNFFLYYNKNYRPIYHIENILLFIILNIETK
jgi:hypothetical protein